MKNILYDDIFDNLEEGKKMIGKLKKYKEK